MCRARRQQAKEVARSRAVASPSLVCLVVNPTYQQSQAVKQVRRCQTWREMARECER